MTQPVKEQVGPTEPSAEELRLLRLKEEIGATWDSPDDPRDPYNWISRRKVGVALLVSSAQLVTLMTASMTVAALDRIAADIGMSVGQAQVSFSVYFLGLGYPPILIAATSEMYGRRPVWLCCNAYFVMWNTLCPVGRNKVLMILGRFMAACGASCGVVLTGPILTDMYKPEMRGRSLAIANLLPYLGPALGPIIGGVAAEHLDWPWLFYIVSFFSAAITLLGCFLLPESYTPALLQHKHNSDTPIEPHGKTASTTFNAFAASCQALLTSLAENARRPIRILLKRPVMHIISLNMGIAFAIYCIVLSTFANLFLEHYHQSETLASLHYIAIALGATIAAQAGGHLMDWIWRKQRPPSRPEHRLPYIAPASMLGIAGLLWYGWATQADAHWAIVDAGACLFVAGSFAASGGFLAYTFDEFSRHAASASAASRILSYTLAFVFPIFGPDLYGRLGYGWGNTLLAGIYAMIVWPSVMLLWMRGPKLRASGKELH